MVSLRTRALGRLRSLSEFQKPMGGICARDPPAAAVGRLLEGLQMTTFVGVFLAAWAIGYALGYKVRMIRTALYAA